jgi:alkanesulfonate monooxygenase SsuD/methylene tetrahydromethanopterin reductase-like flavin-dependent oxidoreductase (luciferase family)
MRRNLSADVNQFPHDVVELLEYFRPTAPGQPLQAVPGAGEEVEVWILGSSTYGAQLAAVLGLPYAFASHFAPGQMHEAVAVYARCSGRPNGLGCRMSCWA